MKCQKKSVLKLIQLFIHTHWLSGCNGSLSGSSDGFLGGFHGSLSGSSDGFTCWRIGTGEFKGRI